MKKPQLILTLMILPILLLAGCANNAVFDADYLRPTSPFKSYDEMKSVFISLEKELDTDRYVSREEVEYNGFSPHRIDTRIMNYRQLVDVFTFHGSLTARDYGISPTKAVLACLRKGKICTAYKASMTETYTEEIPDNSADALKSVLNLEETHVTITWKYSVIIIFEGDKAIHAEFESDYTPPASIRNTKRSFWKKVVRSTIN